MQLTAGKKHWHMALQRWWLLGQACRDERTSSFLPLDCDSCANQLQACINHYCLWKMSSEWQTIKFEEFAYTHQTLWQSTAWPLLAEIVDTSPWKQNRGLRISMHPWSKAQQKYLLTPSKANGSQRHDRCWLKLLTLHHGNKKGPSKAHAPLIEGPAERFAK